MKQKLFIKLGCLGLLLSMAMSVLAQTPPPIGVEIVSFTAIYSPGQVLVEWVTATELDNAGFIVTRSTSLTQPFEEISPFILARGSGAGGADYEFIDEDIVFGTTYFYMLQAWDTNNQFEEFGPISVYTSDIAGIISFTAIYNSGQVLVEWVTATEFETAGFIVKRSTLPSEQFEDISPFILSQGSPAVGAEYEFIDENLVEGTTYYYILQAWDMNNNYYDFGPISVKAQDEQIFLPVIIKDFDPAGGLVVETVKGYHSRYGFLYVNGLVTNTSNQFAKDVELEIEIFDSDSNSLYVYVTKIFFEGLAPGETSPFSVRITADLSDPSRYEARIVSFDSIEFERATLTMEGDQLLVDDEYDLHIVGELINNTNSPIEIKALAAAVFDDNGDLYHAGRANVRAGYLDPGDSTPFRITLLGTGNDPETVSDYRIYVDAIKSPAITKYDLSLSNQYNTYLDYYDEFHFVGEITNTYTESLTFSLVAGVYDADGNVLDAAEYNISDLNIIAPGDTLPFDVKRWGPMNHLAGTVDSVYSSTIQVDPYLSRVSSQDYVYLTTQNNITELHSAYIIFAGEAINNSGSEIERVTVTIRLFDEETKKLIATREGNAQPGPFYPDAIANYFIWLYYPSDLDIFSVDYEILAKGYLP